MKHYVYRLAIVTMVMIVISSGCSEGRQSDSLDAETSEVQDSIPLDFTALRQALEQMRAGTRATDSLEVVYNDMHSFHGGETLTLSGKVLVGKYLSRESGAPTQTESQPTTVTTQQMNALLDLLLEIEAWDQRTPPREPALDESRAGLFITVGELESSIWEWYNDLYGNDRMIKVKQLLEEIAEPDSNE